MLYKYGSNNNLDSESSEAKDETAHELYQVAETSVIKQSFASLEESLTKRIEEIEKCPFIANSIGLIKKVNDIESKIDLDNDILRNDSKNRV